MIHNDYIRSIKYNQSNNSFTTASSDTKNPLKIFDIKNVNREYNFNLDKACTCFDICMELHLLVTVTSKSPINVFNIYSPSKPTSLLNTCNVSVIDLKIHYPINYLYALSVYVNIFDFFLNICFVL